MDYDAIVIGGGPAGSSFARIAAGKGMNVLVLDKRKEIGVPVRCGEGLSERESERAGLEIPERCYSLDIEGARVFAPNGKSIVWKTKDTRGWVLERKIFDKWLCELAVEKGAEVRVYSRATGLIKEDGNICGVRVTHGGRKEYEARAPLVVSAEGMEALIAREAGFNTVHRLQDVYSCYQYEMEKFDNEKLIEMHFGRSIAPGGYIWIFPKDNGRANVGIAIVGSSVNGEKNSGIEGAAPKKLLDEFIGKHGQLNDASTLVDFGGVISAGAPLDEFVKDNFMIFGTAAKQVDPIHGGGIALAMEAGLMAAETAVKAFGKKDYSKETLSDYEKRWKEKMGKKQNKRLMLRKIVAKFSDDDLNHIFNKITYDDLEKVMAGNFSGPAAKILATRPQLLGVLGAILPGKN